MWFGNIGDCTLGTGAIGISVSLGTFSMGFSCAASVTSVLYNGSPAAKLGFVVVVVGVKMVIMSPASCTKKTFNLILGNGVTVEKNVTVSQPLSTHVCGK